MNAYDTERLAQLLRERLVTARAEGQRHPEIRICTSRGPCAPLPDLRADLAEVVLLLLADLPAELAAHEELDGRGFLLAVATGKSRVGLARALAQHGIADRFAASRCADEGFPKPHPDMLLALMDRLGVEPAETLMIGDTTHDLELARNAGVSALAVAYGAHPSAGLMAMRPLTTAHSVTELRAWLAANA